MEYLLEAVLHRDGLPGAVLHALPELPQPNLVRHQLAGGERAFTLAAESGWWLVVMHGDNDQAVSRRSAVWGPGGVGFFSLCRCRAVFAWTLEPFTQRKAVVHPHTHTTAGGGPPPV